MKNKELEESFWEKRKEHSELLKINRVIRDKSMPLKDLEMVSQKLLELYLNFMFTKSVTEQIKDICMRKKMNGKSFLNIVKLAIGSDIDDVFPLPLEGKSNKNKAKSL